MRHRITRKTFHPLSAMLLILVIFCFLDPRPASCLDPSAPMVVEKAAAAQADECFYEPGSTRNYFNPDDLTPDEIRECLDNDGLLKRNLGYLWGLTKTEDTLWFGMGSNIMEVKLSIRLGY